MSVLDLYTPRTKPFEHQLECLECSYTKRSFAYLMDPGLGKSKVSIDIAALWFLRGHIQGMLIAAPNDVHAQWIEEQLPEHLPAQIATRTLIWRSNSQKVRKQAQTLLKPIPQRLHILSMNHEAFATKVGRTLARQFLKTYPSLFVLDDSHEFKTPAAARTRAVNDMSDLAFGRRILTGTLTGGVPFHLYSQFRFLDPNILKCKSFLVFKHRYGIFNTNVVLAKPNKKTGKRVLVEYEELQEYQNLDELNALIAPFIYSKHKEDCKDLPPKIYQHVPTHLSQAQKNLSTRLLEDGVALLARPEGEATLALPLAEMEEYDLVDRLQNIKDRMTYQIKLTLFLRLQQIAAGIVSDDDRHITLVDGTWDKCPRIVDAIKWVKQALTARGKVIVWGHYRMLLESLHRAFKESDIPNLLVHGGITGQARADRIKEFKSPEGPRVLIAHPRTLGTGQNFEIATSVLFYTRSYSLFQRRQAEDRAHRLSSIGTVTIGDMVARDCASDEKELQSLETKQDLADRIETFDLKQMLGVLR
jgi:hypothetical protein